MHKQTVVDQIEITRDGSIQIRFAKEIVDDDGTVVSKTWHRTMLTPDGDLDFQMAAVNENLVRDLGYPAVAAADVDRVKALLPVVHTPEIKATFTAEKARREAARLETRVKP